MAFAGLRRTSTTLLVIAALACADRAAALDPSRALTQYVHRIWQTQQGLPQAAIDALLQTSDGQLWLGTQTGLVRFDGVRFTTVDSTSGVAVPAVWITALVEDSTHALWIGTDESGVYRLSGHTVTAYAREDGLPSTDIRCLFVGPSGHVWACTPNGLAAFNGTRFETFPPDAAHPLGEVAAACVDGNSRVWVAHDRDRLDTWSALRYREQPIALSKDGSIRSVMCTDSGDVWVGTSDGVVAISAGKQHWLTTSDGLADNNVLTIARSRSGAVLVGTTNGFSRIRGRDVESFRSANGLSQSAVYALLEDREGTLWAATGHGLNQFVDGRATPYTIAEGLPSNNAGPIAQDRFGTIWAGTLDAGLARFDGHRFSALTTKDGLPSNVVLAVVDDPGGGLWVGTDRGLSRLRGGRVDLRLTTASGLPSNVVTALRFDERGLLWIGTLKGAATYHGNRVERVAGSIAPIVALGATADGRALLAPRDGALEAYADGRLQLVGSPTQSFRDVDAIYTDRDGIVWIGTAGDGLFSVERGHISKYTMREGLFDDSIYAVLADDFGRLWMACSKGIFSVDRAQLLRVASGQARKFVSTPYSPTDVLRTIECKPGIQPAAWRTADGQLWFATTRGLLVLDSRNADRRFDPPVAAIEEATVNGARVASDHDLGRLRPGENNVAFRYTGLSFVAPTRITFKYRLEGFDAAWTDAGVRREAFYTNLPPGRFRFRVAACNPENACRETAGIAFEVEPRYYQHAWFIPLCIGLAIAAGAAGVRLHIRRLRDQFALILVERARIARELHDTLIQGFSGVTMEMQALSARLPAAERARLEQIVGDAGVSLREARQSLVSLRRGADRVPDFANAIAQTSRQLVGANSIRLDLELERWSGTLPSDVEYNLMRILQEAVINAVKHSGTRTLLVALERTASQIRLLIRDEGAGFARDNKTRPGHFGVVGMRERAAQIGARFDLETAPGHGTAVIVTMDA
jgi:ligand-binding sensor domain-containing protein/signal transduction histidine kinase